jgi:hypothetical protein
MALSIAKYIMDAEVSNADVRFAWDEWNVEQAEEPIDEQLRAQLGDLSQRALLAYSSGVAEWVVQRFASLTDVRLPLCFAEAAWAISIDRHYCRQLWQQVCSNSQWTGPVKGPIRRAMLHVQYAITALSDEDYEPDLIATWVTNLARYVLFDKQPFAHWLERVLPRLVKVYSCSPEDPLGDVVPREALDPNRDFDVSNTDGLINHFLSQLDYGRNPFLNAPEKMISEGFSGTPYVFDGKSDKQLRLDVR